MLAMLLWEEVWRGREHEEWKLEVTIRDIVGKGTAEDVWDNKGDLRACM